MNKYLSLLLLLLISLSSYGKELSIGINAGYGFYQLKDIKQYQSSSIRLFIPTPIEAVERFPNYYTYSATLDYGINSNLFLGLEATLMSTGGRNHVKDYSGEFKLDMLLTGYKVGLSGRAVVKSYDNFKLYTGIKSGIIFSELDFDYYFIVYQVDTSKNDIIFRSKTLFAEPFMGFDYTIRTRFNIHVNLGYEIDLPSKLKNKERDDYELNFPNGDDLFLNWSGFRLSLGISYKLF